MMMDDVVETLKERLSELSRIADATAAALDDLEVAEHIDRAHTKTLMPEPARMSLSKIQPEVYQWSRRNFPESTAQDKILGMQEELGELSRAFLKARQGIRGFSFESAETKEAIADAMGDVIIYMLDFASHMGVDLEERVLTTWAKVRQRDWVTYPENAHLIAQGHSEITLD